MPEVEKQRPPAKRLGKGMGNLIAENVNSDIDGILSSAEDSTAKPQQADASRAPSLENGDRVAFVDIEKIERNPDQPRRQFEPEALKELSKSISNQGIIQPIVVKEVSPNKYQIIAGERRWRAAQMAGLHRMPCVIKGVEIQQALEMALVENIQRKDLNPIEEAKAYRNLMEKFKLTQQEVADKVGKDRATVANLLRVLSLPTEAQTLVESGSLSLGQAKVLLALKDPGQILPVAKECIAKSLSVRAVEKIVGRVNLGPEVKPVGDEASLADRALQQLREDLQKVSGSRVEIDYQDGRGRVSMYFYTGDQLNELADRLKKAWSP